MRKVAYYCNGGYCELSISDEDYDDLAQQTVETKFIKEDLSEATRTLQIAFVEGLRTGALTLEEPELIAAFYIWWYFNDRIKKGPLIEGDIIVIDKKGDGNVEYTALDGVKYEPKKKLK